MSIAYDYTAPVKITITNAIDVNNCKYKACDAGTPVQKVPVPYKDIADKPCVKFDYIFEANGEFKKNAEGNVVVLVHQKFKNTDRKLPAYRTFNGKTLKAGDKVVFETQFKEEVVFFEKVVEAFGSKLDEATGEYVGGELTMKVEPATEGE